MMRLFKEHLDANKEDLTQRVIYGSTIDPVQMQDLAQLKGQILAFEKMLDIKTGLMDLTEDYPEVNKDEV